MNYIQLIEELCLIVSQQSEVIKRLTLKLSQLSALSDEERRAWEDLQARIDDAIGGSSS